MAKLVGDGAKQLILGQLPTEMRADAETLFDESKFPPLGTVPTNTSTIHGGTAPGEACPCTWCPKGSPGTMGCLSWERQPPLRLADGLEVLFIRNDFVVEKYGNGIQHSIWASTRRSPGEAWSVPAPTGIPDAGSNFAAGLLPDGRMYIVNNGAGVLAMRNPLTISVAAAAHGPGATRFTHASAIAWMVESVEWGSCYTATIPVRCELSYPSVVLADRDGTPGLWATYSVQESDVGVSWVPLSALGARSKTDDDGDWSAPR